MISFEQLKAKGSTQERLKEVFTAIMPDMDTVKDWTPEQKAAREKDIDRRSYWEKKIMSRLTEHVVFSLKNYQMYAAVDLAWDAAPITQDTIPLIQYAQGKIKLESVATSLESAGRGQYVTKDAAGKPTGIDLPMFIQTECNLVRSIVTRRLAAQSAKYSNLWPHFKYEARGTSQVAKLRADVISMVSDIIADQFDYKHHEVQVIRDMMLYGKSVDFVRAAWECEKQLLPNADGVTDAVPVKEGLSFFNPHPSRTFWDTNFSLSSLNTDTGSNYVGYWDVRRYGDLIDNQALYNTDKVKYSQSFFTAYMTYPAYFTQYYQDSIRITNPEAPVAGAGGGRSPTEDNDRKAYTGFYSGEERDQSVLITEYFEKVIPAAHGLGEYPFPVWLRLLVAGDGTVMFAEFLPSTPCAVYSFNENDSRLRSISIAHEVMPFQDQMSNLLTAMLHKIQQELLTFVSINRDAIPDEVQRKAITRQLQGGMYANAPIVAEVSFSRLEEQGIKAGKVFEITRAVDQGSVQSITDCIRGMSQLIQIMERLIALSPHEQGQTASHEITAKETSVIEATTSTVYGFISDSVDEGRSAKKRIVFESYVACSNYTYNVPVIARYSKETVQKAGFAMVDDTNPNSQGPQSGYVVGANPKMFGSVHDYIFTSRDGAERPVNTQAANVAVQLLGSTIGVPGVLQWIGKAKLCEMLNEIWRMAGSGIDLGLEPLPGEDNGFGATEAAQIGQALQQFAKQMEAFVQQQQQTNQQLGQQAAQTAQELPALGQAVAELSKHVEEATKRIATVEQGPSVALEKVLESVKYEKAPADVQRQLEAGLGLRPSIMTAPAETETTPTP